MNLRLSRALRLSLLVVLVPSVLIGCGSTAPSTAAPPTTAGTSTPTTASTATFTVSSPAMQDGGTLPVDFTCDGAAVSPPLAWSTPPAGTTSLAIVMHHVPGPGDTHWYWVLYDIPASVTAVARGATDVGVFGTNSVNGDVAYTPPCSKGPGAKTYTLTVYALSAPPTFTVPRAQVSRDVLLTAIGSTTLASASMDVTYSRTGSATAGPMR